MCSCVTRSRVPTLLVTVVVLLSCSGVAVTTAGAAQPSVQISSVTVTPSDPAPGESVTVETTISNLEGSNGAIDITDIYVRTSETAKEQERVENVGTISPGNSLTVPMSITFSDTGNKKLTVYVVVQDEDGEYQTYEYPVSVTVEKPNEALLSLSTTTAAADSQTPVNVTVANGYTGKISGVQLNLTGSGTVESPERIKGSIASGSEHTFQYDVTFDEVGTRTLTAEVTYTNDEGMTRTVTKSIDVNVEEPVVKADLAASSSSSDGSSVTTVELTNFGNTLLSDVQITATADGEVIARKKVADVEPDASSSATFDDTDSVAGTITYTATYTAAGSDHSTTINDRSEVPGEIYLTGVDITQTGTTVTLQGDAANIGSTDTKSVLLSVNTTGGVSSTASSGEYFVGAIEGSEFATFELTARTQQEASSIPIDITYIVNGKRVTKTQRVALESTNSTAPGGVAQAGADGNGQASASGPGGRGGFEGPGNSGGILPTGLLSGLPLTEIGIVLLLAIIGAIGYATYRWRNP